MVPTDAVQAAAACTLPTQQSASVRHQLKHTWGSMSNGQRLPLVTMTPLAVLNASAGRPCMFQSCTVGGAARKPQKSKLSLAGMQSCFTCRATQPQGRASSTVPGV